MTLDEIVKERFLDEKPDDPATCPYCGSLDVEVLSKSSTLVGYSGPVNPNHLWHASVCKGCGEHYTREIKRHNVWYTGDRPPWAPVVFRALPVHLHQVRWSGGAHP